MASKTAPMRSIEALPRISGTSEVSWPICMVAPASSRFCMICMRRCRASILSIVFALQSFIKNVSAPTVWFEIAAGAFFARSNKRAHASITLWRNDSCRSSYCFRLICEAFIMAASESLFWTSSTVWRLMESVSVAHSFFRVAVRC